MLVQLAGLGWYAKVRNEYTKPVRITERHFQMPKWFIHKELARIVGIDLSNKQMIEIDSKLDGIEKGYVHDPWKYDVEAFRRIVSFAHSNYGDVGAKYCFLRAVLDTAQERTVSEKTRESLRARYLRNLAHQIGFQDAYGILDLFIKENLDEYYKPWKELQTQLKNKESELSATINQLPEMKRMVDNIERFKQKSAQANLIAKSYPRARYSLRPVYINFILELQSKKRGLASKNEWAEQVLEKYRGMGELVYRDLKTIATKLGYLG